MGGRPGSAGCVNMTFSRLEDIYAPKHENRRAMKQPHRTRSFDLALRRNQEFDAIDPKVGAFNRSFVQKALEETVAHRVSVDRSHRSKVASHREGQRERFNSLAYSRFIAAVRRREPHAVARWNASQRQGNSRAHQSASGFSMRSLAFGDHSAISMAA